MDNLEEMDRFFGKFNPPKLNQEEIEIMNKSIANTEMKAVIKKSSPTPQSKDQGQMASQVNSIKYL